MNDGGSAFPSPTGNPMQDGGITVRDFFAAKAMQGMCASLNLYDNTDTQGKTLAEYVADHAYFMADAMLAERAKHE